MSGMSSHIIWRERYDAAADMTLARALAALQREVRELPSQQWDAGTSSIGGVRDYKCSYASPAAAEWSSVLLHLNALNGEQLAAELSRLLSAPSIVLSEYDQTAWGYALFLDGAAADNFCSVQQSSKWTLILYAAPLPWSAVFSVCQNRA